MSLDAIFLDGVTALVGAAAIDRKSTRLNSSHGYISYAVFCLKKKKKKDKNIDTAQEHTPNPQEQDAAAGGANTGTQDQQASVDRTREHGLEALMELCTSTKQH